MILCGMEQLFPFTDEQTEAQRSSMTSLTPPILGEEKLHDSREEALWATIYSATGLWARYYARHCHRCDLMFYRQTILFPHGIMNGKIFGPSSSYTMG